MELVLLPRRHAGIGFLLLLAPLRQLVLPTLLQLHRLLLVLPHRLALLRLLLLLHSLLLLLLLLLLFMLPLLHHALLLLLLMLHHVLLLLLLLPNLSILLLLLLLLLLLQKLLLFLVLCRLSLTHLLKPYSAKLPTTQANTAIVSASRLHGDGRGQGRSRVGANTKGQTRRTQGKAGFLF